MPTTEPERTPEEGRLLTEIGRRVYRLRTEAGMTQMLLADKAGLHYTYIGQVERGKRNIAVLNLYGLAAALEADVGDLLPPVPRKTAR